MIRTRPYHWERRRAWRTTIGWLIAAAIPLAVAVVVALTGGNVGDVIVFGGSVVAVEVIAAAIHAAREPMWITPEYRDKQRGEQ